MQSVQSWDWRVN